MPKVIIQIRNKIYQAVCLHLTCYTSENVIINDD